MLLIASGRLDAYDGVDSVSVGTADSLLLINANTSADLRKTPGGTEKRFRSVFLTLAPELLEAFYRLRAMASEAPRPSRNIRHISLDEDLAATLAHLLESLAAQPVSDERLRYRAMDLLAALAERGQGFAPVAPRGFIGRLRSLISKDPGQHWTAHTAASALAVSEATLRRRLWGERARFEEVLIGVRMHHAMMLLQTTTWNLPQIAQACGY